MTSLRLRNGKRFRSQICFRLEPLTRPSALEGHALSWPNSRRTRRSASLQSIAPISLISLLPSVFCLLHSEFSPRAAPSSRGLGHQILNLGTRVRLPLGPPISNVNVCKGFCGNAATTPSRTPDRNIPAGIPAYCLARLCPGAGEGGQHHGHRHTRGHQCGVESAVGSRRVASTLPLAGMATSARLRGKVWRVA